MKTNDWPKALDMRIQQALRLRASPDDCGICSRRPEICARDDSHEYEQRNRRGKPATAEIINAAKDAAKTKGEVA